MSTMGIDLLYKYFWTRSSATKFDVSRAHERLPLKPQLILGLSVSERRPCASYRLLELFPDCAYCKESRASTRRPVLVPSRRSRFYHEPASAARSQVAAHDTKSDSGPTPKESRLGSRVGGVRFMRIDGRGTERDIREDHHPDAVFRHRRHFVEGSCFGYRSSAGTWALRGYKYNA